MLNTTKNRLSTKYQAKEEKISTLLIGGLIVTAFMTAFLPRNICSIIFTALLVILFFTPDFYMAFPIILFFYSYLILPVAGVSVYRVYTILLFIKIFSKKIKIERDVLALVLSVYTIYILCSIAPLSIWRAMILLFDVVVILMWSSSFFGDRNSDVDKIKRFFMFFVFTALLAYPYGVITNNFIKYTSQNDYTYAFTRYMATFEDPNYMGLFFSIAIFATLTLKLFSLKIRVVVIICLEAFLLGSISITAIIGNAVFWLLYLIFTEKLKGRYLVSIVFVVLIVFVLYEIASNNSSLGFLSQVAKRIQEKIDLYVEGDINAVTTGRQNLFLKHLELYWNQDSVIKLLFGGHLVNAKFTKGEIFKTVTHNEYVTWLLNVGLVGAVLLMLYSIGKLVARFKEYKKNNDLVALTFLMTRCIWMFYACTLTLFLDERFFVFYIL